MIQCKQMRPWGGGHERCQGWIGHDGECAWPSNIGTENPKWKVEAREMTTCKSWCGKQYMDDKVPHQNIARGTVFMVNPGLPGDLVNVEQPAYCSQACLDRATAKPTRKLAKGWVRRDYKPGCTKDLGGRCCGQTAPYDSRTRARCEEHAEADGVFEHMAIVEALRPIQEQCDAIERRLLGLPDKAVDVPKCGRCTHRHVGPCNGTSPNGEYSCPCGHERVEARREVLAVGTYRNDGDGIVSSERISARMIGSDYHMGHTATLLANLDRERVPSRRPIRTVRWYEGNGDE